MSVIFSQRPGAHERHYRRKLANPLFKDSPPGLDPGVLLEAQRQDHEALVAFISQLKQLIGEVVNLPPTADSDRVLTLKERLDKAYEQASGLAEDQQHHKQAIRRLLEVIMGAVRRGAAGDQRAEEELEQEVQARALHFSLLEYPLVADLLAPDSLIGADELAPSLLSSEAPAVEAALGLFNPEQLRHIAEQSRTLLARVDPDCRQLSEAWDRLRRIEARLGATAVGQPHD